MKLLPFERLNLRTSESPEAIVARLDRMVAPNWFCLKDPPQPFLGTLNSRRFKIVRTLLTLLRLRYWNLCQPLIVGEIVPVAEGTEVRAKMRLHAFVAVSGALWLAFDLAICVVIAFRVGFAAGAPALLIGCGMAACAYALVSISFWSEVKKARALLREGLKCE